jgi:hypothetical protein
MKKVLLSVLGLAIGLGAVSTAKAQVGAAIGFARMMHKKSTDKDDKADKPSKADSKVSKNVSPETYQGKSFSMQRTPADQLPKVGAEQVTALETELDRSHSALAATSTGALFTPEQRQALQTALVGLAKSPANGNLAAYQQEAAFYLAEDARRQQAAPAPAK